LKKYGNYSVVITLGVNVDKDTKILAQFIEVYCRNKHSKLEKTPWKPHEELAISSNRGDIYLCQGCSTLLEYSAKRRRLCPLDPKPTCKKCEIHCYIPEYRSKIREVMRFSGMHMIKRGRIDMIFHYLF
jgi:hypothetical protein